MTKTKVGLVLVTDQCLSISLRLFTQRRLRTAFAKGLNRYRGRGALIGMG
jgi:hypothetical protein